VIGSGATLRKVLRPLACDGRQVLGLTYIHSLVILVWYRVLRIFTVQRYASAVYAMALCPSVSVYVCHIGVPSKRTNTHHRANNAAK